VRKACNEASSFLDKDEVAELARVREIPRILANSATGGKIMKPIRIGVIGCGAIAQVQHLPNLAGLQEEFEVTIVCDHSPGLAKSVAKTFHVPNYVTDYRQLLESDVEAVILCHTDPKTEVAVAAFEAGKHVFIEKPMCFSLQEADAIINAAHQSGKVGQVGYMKVYDPAFEIAKQQVDVMDNIRFVQVNHLHPNNALHLRQFRIQRCDDIPPGAYDAAHTAREKALHDAIGDVPNNVKGVFFLLAGSMIHDIYGLRVMLGMPSAVVSTEIWNGSRAVTIVLEYPQPPTPFGKGDGARCVATWVDLPNLWDFKETLEVYGDDKRVIVSYPTGFARGILSTVTVQGIDADGTTFRKEPAISWESAFVRELRHFHECITDGIPSRTSVESARDDIALIIDIINSYQKRGTLEKVQNLFKGCKPEEMAESKKWIENYLQQEASVLPFSFKYDGQPSANLLKKWKIERDSNKLDECRTQHTLTYTDSKTGLKVRCVAIEYKDYPAVEWVLFFENTGSQESPILGDIQAANVTFTNEEPGDFVLYHADGSRAVVTDFQPLKTELTPGMTKNFLSYGGRSSDSVLPFFNLKKPDGNGIITAVGWTGQWAASFTRDGGARVNFQAGMELTHLKLYLNEKIRTPAILLLFWNGDFMRGQNQLRKLLLNHYSPTSGGALIDPPTAASPHKVIRFESTTEANMIQGINNIASHNLPVDTWWIDAGWYSCTNPKTGKANWAAGVGNCDADPDRYPNGMKPVADAAHKNGLKFLLWFEPERVMVDTWLYKNHPDWLLAPADLPPEQQYQARDGFYLLNLGNPQALAWLKTRFSGMIGSVGIDIYRHDFNIHPLHYWRNGEAPDRQGMNEIRYIMGLYDYFDTLLRDHPNLLIDNCASGGRRLDFEMLRRSIPLWRSDLCWDATAEQCMTYGLSLWMPLHGVGSISLDPYDFRSGMGVNFSASFDYNDNSIWDPATKLLHEYRSIKHLFMGDFYPLTPYSVSQDVWIAWQFNRPELSEGLVQAFRRPGSDVSGCQFRLSGLEPDTQYELTNFDVPGKTMMTGRELMEKGLEVYIKDCPGAVVITYR
jgi:alpha-galactosidase